MALRKSFLVAEKPIAALGLVAPPPIQVDFPKFSGSLAQLFAVVREHKIDLLEVPLLPICEAYFQYLLGQESPDLNESAAALAALSFLLERKAGMLLPSDAPIDEEEIVLELVERTIHEFFAAVDFLRFGFEQRTQLYFRTTDQTLEGYELPLQTESLELSALSEALSRVLARNRPPAMQSVTRIGRMLEVEMEVVLSRLSAVWQTFEMLLEEKSSREDAVYVFLSLLELMRLGQAKARIVEDRVEFIQA